MSERDNGGYAFPTVSHTAEVGEWIHEGMTLRDYFAGQALAACMHPQHDLSGADAVARAYAVADAMLAERAKGGGDGYSGFFTLRDCQRSVDIELDDDGGGAREALTLIRDYAERGLRWIDRCEKRMREEAADAD